MLDRAHFCKSKAVFFLAILYESIVGGRDGECVTLKLVFAGNFLFRGAWPRRCQESFRIGWPVPSTNLEDSPCHLESLPDIIAISRRTTRCRKFHVVDAHVGTSDISRMLSFNPIDGSLAQMRAQYIGSLIAWHIDVVVKLHCHFWIGMFHPRDSSLYSLCLPSSSSQYCINRI